MALTSAPNSLNFDRSDSKAVGVEGPMMASIRDNAPRIVGGMKLIGDALILTSTIASATPIGLLFYGLFAIPGRIIMMTYGTKEHKEKVAREMAERGETPHEAGFLEKVTNPSRYPIESSSGLSILAEGSALSAAAEKMFANPSWEAAGNGLLEVLAVWMYGNMLFGKEKPSEPDKNSTQDGLTFAHSESKPVGLLGKLQQTMKDNPVMTSCLVGVGISLALMITGAPLYGPLYLAGAAVLMAANLLQGLLVRKNDFNVEGGDKAASHKTSFQERLAQRVAMPSPHLGS